jgi:XapX domain-containing protein
MKPYILSLLGGVLAGAIYSLLRVRSPAPPMIALVGLLGIVIGTQIIPTGRQFMASTTPPFRKTETVQTQTQTQTKHTLQTKSPKLISRAAAEVSPN